VLTTDGKGQTTRLLRTGRGFPSLRSDPKGKWCATSTTRRSRTHQREQRHVPLRLRCLGPLVEEVRVDNLTRRFTYNDGEVASRYVGEPGARRAIGGLTGRPHQRAHNDPRRSRLQFAGPDANEWSRRWRLWYIGCASA